MAEKSTSRDLSLRATAAAITQWTPGIKPTWTIREVRTALRLHAQGDFSLSALLVDSMGEDDAIPGLLEKLVDAVLKEDFCLEPVEAPNRQLSKQIARELGPVWWDMFPEAEIDDLARWLEMLGVAIGWLERKKTPTRWTVVLHVLHPQYLWRDQAQGKWFYNAQEGQLEVTPGDGTWILLTVGDRGWMRGKVRSAAIPWIGKQLTIRDQGRYNERHGLPIVKAIVPAIADEGDRDEFWEDVKGIQGDAVAELLTHVDGENPDSKYDLDLLEAQDKSHDAFKDTLDRWDRRLTILFLGGNQSTEVTGTTGTKASANQHANELVDKAQANEKRLSTGLRKQGLWPVVAFNYASAVYEVTPWPHWDVLPPEDTKAEAEDQKSFGEALSAVQDAGYEVENVVELGEKHGLKLAKKEAPALPPAPTPPAKTVDPDEEDDDPETEDTLDIPVEYDPGMPVLASRASAKENRGFIEGQLYTDALVERSTGHAAALLAGDVQKVLAVIAEATDYPDLRARLNDLFTDLDPELLSEIVDQTMQLSELAGRAAVQQDA